MNEVPDHDKVAAAITNAGTFASKGMMAEARDVIVRDAPFTVRSRTSRNITNANKLIVWRRDSFRCRYTGARLFLPVYLRALSMLLPEAFPYHKDGRFEECHDAHWGGVT